MNRDILSQRWPWVTAIIIVVVVYLGYAVSTGLDALQNWNSSRRPLGTVEDIEGLASRDDVNVLFILIDTLRSDHLGTYGYDRNTSPLLDDLAASGVRFDRHLSQSSWTKCSMASMWSGLYPTSVGVTRFEHTLSQEALMPAEIMRDAGYTTVGMFRNGWVAGYFGFEQGFDVYMRPVGRPASPDVKRENPTLKSTSTDDSLIEPAVEFARINRDRRWLLYLHMMDLHEYLYDEGSAKFGTGYLDVYDNSILRENLILNDLFAKLDREGLMKNTLIVVTSDHGEAFSERGFEGHARRVYRETTDVPFIINFPFRLEEGIGITSRSRNIDIWPTILDLLGLPEMPEIDGRSRVPEILAAARGEQLVQEDGTGIAHLDQNWGKRGSQQSPSVAVLEDSFRYVMDWDEARNVPTERMFDSRDDPLELTNILANEPEVADRLRIMASDYLKRSPVWKDAPPDLEMDEMQLNQLRALGYKIP